MLFEVHARGINLEGSSLHELIDQAFSSVVQPYRRAVVKLSVVVECHNSEAPPTHECRAAVDLFGRPSVQVDARALDAEDVIHEAAKKLLASLATIFERK